MFIVIIEVHIKLRKNNNKMVKLKSFLGKDEIFSDLGKNLFVNFK